jgi:hypothetical protein
MSNSPLIWKGFRKRGVHGALLTLSTLAIISLALLALVANRHDVRIALAGETESLYLS